MPRLLTYGDSNTHGTVPIVVRGQWQRYDAATRWPTRVQAALGPDWELIEEGLPGRTTAINDPVQGDHMNGQTGLKIALQSHGPLDFMTLMLGTNDTKGRMMADPGRILGGIQSLIDIATSPDMAARHPGLRILLICPPPVEGAGVLANDFLGAPDRARALAPLFRAYAARRGLGFLDAGEVIGVSPVDGVHFTAAQHADLAQAVAEKLRALAG